MLQQRSHLYEGHLYSLAFPACFYKKENVRTDMPPKRKIVDQEKAVDERDMRRQKTGNESVDASFQYLNDDISRIIINYLTNNIRDLLALSLVSSSWHNKSNNFLNKCIKQHMPLSFKRLSVAQRNNACGGFFKTLRGVRDVQIFTYQEPDDGEDNNECNVYVVPWDHNIVVQKSDTRLRILDVTKEVPLLSIKTTQWHERDQKNVVFNEKHKLLGLYVHEQEKENLYVYSVNNGQISLQCKTVVNEGDGIGASIFIDNDRMVWLMGGVSFNRYSIDKKKMLGQDFLKDTDEGEEDDVTILAARQAAKGVDFYFRTGVEEYDDVPIYVINSVTKRRKELLKLPNYDYPPSIDWQANHIAIESTGSNCSHFYVYSREAKPQLRLYVSEYNGSTIQVSPDGTRFTLDQGENTFKLFEITGLRDKDEGDEDNEDEEKDDDEENEDEDEDMDENDRVNEGSNVDDNKFSRQLSTITIKKNKNKNDAKDDESEEREMWTYQWASKDVVVGLSVDSLAVMDLSTGQREFESFELPVKAQWVLYHSSLTFVDEKTFMVSAMSDNKDELYICKITI